MDVVSDLARKQPVPRVLCSNAAAMHEPFLLVTLMRDETPLIASERVMFRLDAISDQHVLLFAPPLHSSLFSVTLTLQNYIPFHLS